MRKEPTRSTAPGGDPPGKLLPPLRRDVPALRVAFALFAVTLLLYARTGGNDFVVCDDPGYIVENPLISQGISAASLRFAFTGPHGANWHPLTTLSHILDCQLFGLDPAWHHRESALFHALNAALLFLALRALTGRLWPGALVAILFAVHPLRVESVAWASERKDVLSGLFWMLTLLAYARYAARPGRVRYLLVFLLLSLGLMAKPMLVSLPAVLLLLDIWPLRRWRPGTSVAPGHPAAGANPSPLRGPEKTGESSQPPPSTPLGRLALEKLPWLVPAVVVSVVTFLVQKSSGTMGPIDSLSPGWRLANAAVSYIAYIWKTIWPSGLAVFYPHPGLARSAQLSTILPSAAGAAILLAAVTVIVIRALRRRPYLAVGWFWYLGTLLPVIGLIQVGSQARADRYAYLPLIGIYIAVVWGVEELVRRRARLRRVAIGAAIAAVAACAAVSWIQIGYWKNSRTLLGHAVRVTSGNYWAYNNLGVSLSRAGDLPEALEAYRRAVEIRPVYSRAQNNLGYALLKLDRPAEAKEPLERAIHLDPGAPEPHYHLGLVYEKLGDLGQAAEQFEEALRRDPQMASAQNNLGALYDRAGDLDRARRHYEEALRIQPDYAVAHANLGFVQLRQGQMEQARESFEQALRLDPSFELAQRGLKQVEKAAEAEKAAGPGKAAGPEKAPGAEKTEGPE